MIKYSYAKEAEDDEFAIIKIEEGDFKGIMFSFDKVKFAEKNDHLHISYNYNVINVDEFPDIDSKEIQNITTEILNDILSEDEER